ncbi:hypothetical protein FBUS_01873 [Fasciolopsis buskii]|uniref:Uncharacterized protein n=1 Tax=Fasciolopsis buskii TaxID=27845 RepID=A0A8E0VGB3_9TREM|nr:hypothetical protein FBUS_01873 [Fasciolopsis buski]
MYRFPDSVSHSTICENLLPFAVTDYAKYDASAIPRPRMHFDEFVDWCVEHINALEVRYGSTTVLLIGASVLFVSLSSLALLLVSCFWWVGGFERSVERSQELEIEEYEAVHEDDGGDTHTMVVARRLDHSPHEAGDDGGVHRSRRSKRE